MDAFATGGLPKIIAFHRYLRNTSNPSRLLASQYPLQAHRLSRRISQRTDETDYERFKPNKRDYHSSCWCYRGGWHQSYPALIPKAIYTQEKQTCSVHTWGPLLTLSRIGKFSRLLRSVEPGPLSQCPSPCSHSHGRYGSSAWEAVTPTIYLIHRRPILRRKIICTTDIPVIVVYRVLSSVSRGYPRP